MGSNRPILQVQFTVPMNTEKTTLDMDTYESSMEGIPPSESKPGTLISKRLSSISSPFHGNNKYENNVSGQNQSSRPSLQHHNTDSKIIIRPEIATLPLAMDLDEETKNVNGFSNINRIYHVNPEDSDAMSDVIHRRVLDDMRGPNEDGSGRKLRNPTRRDSKRKCKLKLNCYQSMEPFLCSA